MLHLLQRYLLIYCQSFFGCGFTYLQQYNNLQRYDKIQQFEIDGNFVKLIASYLTNRGQYVKINDKRSPTASVTSGEPQGSIIVPLFFILFIKDLPTIIKSSESIIDKIIEFHEKIVFFYFNRNPLVHFLWLTFSTSI